MQTIIMQNPNSQINISLTIYDNNAREREKN